MIDADRAVIDLAIVYLRHHGRVDSMLGWPRWEMAFHLAALLDHLSRNLDRLTDLDRDAVVGCQVPGLVEARFSRSGVLPDGFCDGVQGLVLDGRDQTELAV